MGIHRVPALFYLDLLSVMVAEGRTLSPESLLKGLCVISYKCFLAMDRLKQSQIAQEAEVWKEEVLGLELLHKALLP